jgi:hypothetical protein
VGDPGDHQPPSDSRLAVGLGRGTADGLLAAYDAYGADLIGYAEFLLAARSAGGDEHLADDAAAAVLDALLVAAGAVVDLTAPDRMRSWLLSLTRNECLRRHPGPSPVPPPREAAELLRRGMPADEVTALLGFEPERIPGGAGAAGDGVAPLWLRPALAAAGGPDGAARRAELTRRARPFEPDGFPVPLDRRRLSGRALAWSAAAVVAVALGVLMVVPTGGDAVALQAGPVLAADVAPEPPAGAGPATTPDEPLPTLPDTPFGAGADEDMPATTSAPAPTTSAPPARTTQAEDGADRGSRSAGRLSLTWSPRDVRCGERWAATLRATVAGGDITSVTAVTGGERVALRPDGDGWSAQLTGLPTDRSITVVVYADGGPVRPAATRLSSRC